MFQPPLKIKKENKKHTKDLALSSVLVHSGCYSKTPQLCGSETREAASPRAGCRETETRRRPQADSTFLRCAHRAEGGVPSTKGTNHVLECSTLMM